MGNVFDRGPNPSNEWCLACGKHIRYHYGGKEYRCTPKEEDQLDVCRPHKKPWYKRLFGG